MSAVATPNGLNFGNPASIMQELAEIERSLGHRQNAFEDAAREWFKKKATRAQRAASEFMRASGTVTERRQAANDKTANIGVDEEAEYEAHKVSVDILQTRASICQSLLKAQGRGA
jgi:hypothetical protein